MDVPKPRTPAASSHEKKGSRTPEERISGFATDVWVGRFEAKRVICRGCGKTVKLDQRSDYYDGLWIKHRQRCRKIKAGVRLQVRMSWSLMERG
ncbi:hypothetical protein FB45DRAFT_942858 [Roridomyces roridus]|uniref:Uncharacterized protein n=1 Tax=Roridomyces roridus TaxID=1738132 RepID=A0AAD7FC52_9AGAR|nr:hypothetical protein FB45DRAFT_942858 [Roridomyces roridus]